LERRRRRDPLRRAAVRAHGQAGLQLDPSGPPGAAVKTVLLVALFACASCTSWLRDPRRFGDHIKAPHARHAAAQVECLTCHESIYDAKSLQGRFLPSEDTCLGCHREAKQQGRCDLCHTDVRRAGPWPEPSPTLRVSHADHLAPTKEACKTCHTRLPEPV